MKIKAPLGLIVILALVAGYLLGTEAGRERRDQLRNRNRLEETLEEGDAAVEG